MELFKLLGTIAVESDDANRAIDDTTDNAEKSSDKMVSAFKKIGAAVAAAFAIDKIIDFGKAIVGASAEVAAEEAAFSQIMGTYSDEAAAKVQKIADATGMVNSRLTPYMTSMTAKFKGLGYDVDEATDLASQGLNIAADASAFWDKSLTDSMSALNSFVNGNYEGGEAIGLFANETTLAAWAADNLDLKWKDLTEKEKQFARLQFAEAMQKASGAAGQASKESGAYANVQGNLTEAWRQFKAEIGEPLLNNIVIPAMKSLGSLLNDTLIPAFQNLKLWVGDNSNELQKIAQILGIATSAVIGFITALKTASILNTFGLAIKKANAEIAEYIIKTYAAAAAGVVSNATLSTKTILLGVLSGQIKITTAATMLWDKAQKALNKSMLTNPITLIVLAIAGLVALLVTAYNKNEDFRKAVNSLWKELKTGLKPIIEALKPLLSAMINLFKSVWSLISSLVIPIFKQIISTITNILKVVTPILKVLLQAFNACFKPVITVITNVINVISKIVGAITKAVNAVKSGITKIKNLFTFKWSLPKLKVPKFTISPSGWKVGDLLKGKIPKLSVKWNAEGAIFKKPAILDSAYGLQGVGEAGAEAIAPIDKLQGYVSNAVQSETNGVVSELQRLISMLANYLPIITDNMGHDIVLNDGVLVGKLAPKMNNKLADIQRSNERGR